MFKSLSKWSCKCFSKVINVKSTSTSSMMKRHAETSSSSSMFDLFSTYESRWCVKSSPDPTNLSSSQTRRRVCLNESAGPGGSSLLSGLCVFIEQKSKRHMQWRLSPKSGIDTYSVFSMRWHNTQDVYLETRVAKSSTFIVCFSQLSFFFFHKIKYSFSLVLGHCSIVRPQF